MTASTDTSAVPSTKVIQVTNIAPQATKDQMQTLFGCIGKIEDIRLYPQIRDVSVPVQSRICYVKYFDSLCVAVAQHLTNTVFIDRALIVTPYQSSVGDIPDEYRALDIANQANIVPGLYPSDPKLPAHVVNQIEGIPPNQVIATNDPVLASNGLPPYPQLPITYDARRIEEIRRTLVAINVDENVTDDELINFFQKAGDVKYIRWCSRENDITRYALVEYSDQASIISGLKLNGVQLGSRAVQVTHATQAIAKPMAKSNEAAQREIEEAMTRVKEAQSLISAAIDPVIGILSKDKKHSHSHRRSRSRSHGRSRRRSSSRSRRGHSRSRRRRSRSRSRRRSRSRKRYRSRDRRSRDRKRSRSRKKSRSRDRKRKTSRDKRRSRSKSRRRSRSRSHKKDKKYSSKRKEEKSDKRKDKDKKKDNTPSIIPEVEKKNKSATPDKEKSRSATPPRSNSRSPRSSSKSPRRSSSSGRGKTSEPIKSRSSSHIRRTLSPKRSRTRTPAHKRVSRSPRRSRTPKKRSRKSNSSPRRTRKHSASRHKSRTPTEKRHRRTRSPIRRSPSPRSPPARRVTRTPPSRSPQSPARSVSRSPVRSKRSTSDSRKRSESASRKRSLSVDRSRRSMSIDHKSRSESKSRSHTPGSARSRSPESASPPATRRSTSYTP
ncbi:serine/arginine-rich splicing factor 11 [Sipha flava]|jgi:arginine/serine-rich splicing factor 12|uniref:Putative splicing factor, arginine/serine-rich 7 n=1 Tax=Sipha flava TaxID=143950 RepID=A0A2S2QK32_9HEMI|nr:serine/arginine-rich splicing factor 11 [Sipha flava]